MALNWLRASEYRVVPFATQRGDTIAAIAPVVEERPHAVDTAHTFREFAALAGQGGAVHCAFATTHGLLGLPSLSRRAKIESLDEWALEASQLDLVLSAWDLLRGGSDVDEEFEERLLGAHAKGTPADRREHLASFVAAAVNDAIARQLHRHQQTHTVHVLVPRLDVVPDTADFAISAEPTTLIDAIWAQTIAAIKGWRSDYKLCRCGKNWIEQPPWKRGPKQRSCSDACRALFDQKDEATARRLARKGISRKRIVEATGLRPDRVKRIVEEEQERRKKGAR